MSIRRSYQGDLYPILFGITAIADGLVVVLSLGRLCTDWQMSCAVWVQKKRMQKRIKMSSPHKHQS